VKDNFHEALECIFDKFLKYHLKILLGDFSPRIGSEDIFKPTVGKESLSQLKVQCSHIVTFNKFIWTSPDIKIPHQNGHILPDRRQPSSVHMSHRSGQQTEILTTIWWWQKLGRD
jgi:hypothetical protein